MCPYDTLLRPVLRPSLKPVMGSVFSARIGSPVLSGISVTTDTDSGTIYWVLTTSTTPPSVAAIKAGTGDAAGTIEVISVGTQSVTFNRPAPGTYYPHFVHTNSGVDSDVHTGTGDTV
jgi:hypothetical protein